MSCGEKREYSPADAYVVLVQHISNQWSHRSCFFLSVHKTWRNEADWIFSLSLSLAAILLCPHSLNPVCPSPTNPCSHYPFPSIFLPPNSLSLCSSEIRCSSLWAVVRCERREGVSPSSFNYLQGLQADEGNHTYQMYASVHVGAG